MILTPAEKQTMDLVILGMTNREIARDLGVTEKTIKGRLYRIFGEMGVTNRMQAATVWRDSGQAATSPTPKCVLPQCGATVAQGLRDPLCEPHALRVAVDVTLIARLHPKGVPHG